MLKQPDNNKRCRSRKFCQRGSNFDKFFFLFFFLIDEGREDPSTTISRPSSAFRWRADDGSKLDAGLVAAIFQGMRTCIARKPYILCFSGGSGPPVPPLDPHMIKHHVNQEGPEDSKVAHLSFIAPFKDCNMK